MVQYIAATEVAKMARKELKAAFPGQKFSVRISSGRSLEVNWTDGPATAAVKDLIAKYAGESFDGMTDMRSSRDNGTDPETGERISYLTSFAFANRELSEDTESELRAELAVEIARENNTTTQAVLDSRNFWPAPQTIMRECGYAQDQSLYVFTRQLAEARATK